MKCARQECQSEARYVTEKGALMCGLCCVGVPAIRMSDVPELQDMQDMIRDAHADVDRMFQVLIDHFITDGGFARWRTRT